MRTIHNFKMVLTSCKKCLTTLSLLVFLSMGFSGCSSDDNEFLSFDESEWMQSNDYQKQAEAFAAFYEQMKTPKDEGGDGGVMFFENDHSVSYYATINSIWEFSAFYHGNLPLPDIDFGKYTLLLGKIRLGDGACYIDHFYLDLSQERPVLNVYVERMEGDFAVTCAVVFDYIWQIYPKFTKDEVEVKYYLYGTLVDYSYEIR